MSGSEPQQEKHCWVCFSTELEDRAAEWVSPCRCRGSTKWIHQACLQHWLDEKQRGGGPGPVRCPQCGTEYLVVFPAMGPVVFLLQQVDRALSWASPLAAVGVVAGTVYWSAVTYGAVTVMQVVGHKKGLAVMERADPLFLLMALPTIPVMLVLGKMVRWEDYLIRLWHRRNKGPLATRSPVEGPPTGDHLSVSRTLCGALVFPSVAGLVGRLLFRHVTSDLQRTMLGGATFVLLKGAMKIYLKQQQGATQADRQILNYPETDGRGEDAEDSD